MTEPTDRDEARQALAEERRKLAEQRAKTPRIDRLVRALKEIQEENHFSARMRDLYRGGT